MVRDSRIKEYMYPAFALNGSNQGPFYTDHVLNGEIIKFRVANCSSSGNLILSESGMPGLNIWAGSFASGTAAGFEVYPFVYGVNPTNITGSPWNFYMRSTNNILTLTGSAFSSGTGRTFGPVTIYYR